MTSLRWDPLVVGPGVPVRLALAAPPQDPPADDDAPPPREELPAAELPLLSEPPPVPPVDGGLLPGTRLTSLTLSLRAGGPEVTVRLDDQEPGPGEVSGLALGAGVEPGAAPDTLRLRWSGLQTLSGLQGSGGLARVTSLSMGAAELPLSTFGELRRTRLGAWHLDLQDGHTAALPALAADGLTLEPRAPKELALTAVVLRGTAGGLGLRRGAGELVWQWPRALGDDELVTPELVPAVVASDRPLRLTADTLGQLKVRAEVAWRLDLSLRADGVRVPLPDLGFPEQLDAERAVMRLEWSGEPVPTYLHVGAQRALLPPSEAGVCQCGPLLAELRAALPEKERADAVVALSSAWDAPLALTDLALPPLPEEDPGEGTLVGPLVDRLAGWCGTGRQLFGHWLTLLPALLPVTLAKLRRRSTEPDGPPPLAAALTGLAGGLAALVAVVALVGGLGGGEAGDPQDPDTSGAGSAAAGGAATLADADAAGGAAPEEGTTVDLPGWIDGAQAGLTKAADEAWEWLATWAPVAGMALGLVLAGLAALVAGCAALEAALRLVRTPLLAIERCVRLLLGLPGQLKALWERLSSAASEGLEAAGGAPAADGADSGGAATPGAPPTPDDGA